MDEVDRTPIFRRSLAATREKDDGPEPQLEANLTALDSARQHTVQQTSSWASLL
jgi:hypothetical protein